MLGVRSLRDPADPYLNIYNSSMEFRLSFDLYEIFNTQLGRFGLAYSSFLKSKRSKEKPKDHWERIAFFIRHLLGKASILYLTFFTYLYYRSLSEEEIRELRRSHGAKK